MSNIYITKLARNTDGHEEKLSHDDIVVSSNTIIGQATKIHTMRFRTGIPRSTQSQSA